MMIIFWIIGYGIIYFGAEKISNQIGFQHEIAAIALLVFLCAALVALFRNKQARLWRLKPPKSWITTLPLLILPAVNVWLLFSSPLSVTPDIWYILTVIFAAICEELLFRGFLLVLLSRFFHKNTLWIAVVNSVIFGAFHFLNMIIGHDFCFTLLQVVCAISVSFAFVIITFKTDSILPCIIVHCLTNASSALSKEMVLNAETVLAFTAVSACYLLYGITLYFNVVARKKEKKE